MSTYREPSTLYSQALEALLTPDAVFDAVAGLYCYHRADLALTKEANAAAARLVRLAERLGQDWFEDGAGPRRDRANPDVVYQLYCEAFADLVEEAAPGSEHDVDRYGAHGFVLPNGEAFYSDGSGDFPYFTQAALVRRRVQG